MSVPEWPAIAAAYSALTETARGGGQIAAPWKKFSALAAKTKGRPPEPMRMMFKVLDEIQGNRRPGEIHILDHGCGGGLNVMYLAALGYKNVHGVNVNAEIGHLDRIATEILGGEAGRFVQTDGGRLPYADQTFDFIFSNQVLEHVGNDKIELYYSEEGRVLKPGGGVFHELPHILIPYDSHSRLWFAHMLPRFIRPLAYGVLKSVQQRKFLLHKSWFIARHFDSFLFLRTPGFHRRRVVRHIGAFRDLTLDRLREKFSTENYDPDANPRYRILIDKLVRLPVIGLWLARIFRNLVIIQTLAIKDG